MDEIKTIRFIGFSGPLEDYYSDTLIIDREGSIKYQGIKDNEEISWNSNSKSAGFQILFSTLAILLMQDSFNPIIKDKNIGGYKIEFNTAYEEYSYTFYGLMEENNHMNIRNVLLSFILPYEEAPIYLEHKEMINPSEENIVM